MPGGQGGEARIYMEAGGAHFKADHINASDICEFFVCLNTGAPLGWVMGSWIGFVASEYDIAVGVVIVISRAFEEVLGLILLNPNSL